MTEPVTPLPRREPRPFPVHWLVDSAIVFLAVILVALMFEIGFGAVIIASLAAGFVAAPFTRSFEAKALAKRETQDAGGE